MESIIADPRQSMAPPFAKDFVGLVTKWTFEPMSVTIAYLMVRNEYIWSISIDCAHLWEKKFNRGPRCFMKRSASAKQLPTAR